MAKRTKKVGTTGRFGPRYGVRDRVRTRELERRQHQGHTCPNCRQPRVRRTDTAIWQCRKCGEKFLGGAYVPRTDTGMGVEKAIQGVLDKLRGQAGDDTGGL